MEVIIFTKWVSGVCIGLEYFTDPDEDFNIELNLVFLRICFCFLKDRGDEPPTPPTAPGV